VSSSLGRWLTTVGFPCFSCLGWSSFELHRPGLTIFTLFPLLKREMGLSDIVLARLSFHFPLGLRRLLSARGLPGRPILPKKGGVCGAPAVSAWLPSPPDSPRMAGSFISFACISLGFSEGLSSFPLPLGYVAGYHPEQRARVANGMC